MARSDVQVVDYLDRSVILSQPAQRVIALAPHIVENIFSAGAGDTLVGAVEYSDFPQQAQNIVRVGGVGSLSMEKIVSLSPDLVIIWASAARGNMIQQLDLLNIPVYVDDPKKLADIARSIGDFGILTGRVQQSRKAVDNYLSELQRLRYRYRDRRVDDVTVLYEVWNNPLQTVNGQHIISDVIELCGGKNVFDDALSLAPKINIEAVLDRDPNIIVTSSIVKSKQIWLDYWLQWPHLQAVRNGHLYFIDPNLIQRHTVRILIGAERMCQQIIKWESTMHFPILPNP